jgi:hypothetical protein
MVHSEDVCVLVWDIQGIGLKDAYSRRRNRRIKAGGRT